MNWVVKKIHIIIFPLCVSFMVCLLYRNLLGAEMPESEELKGLTHKDTYWFDMYAGPKKIGFANITIEKTGNEIIITDVRERKIQKEGREKILVESMKCISDLHYAVKSFEFSSSFRDEKGTRTIGNVDAQEINFAIESPDGRRTFTTPTHGKDFSLLAMIMPKLAEKGRSPGTVFSVPILDFKDLTIRDTQVTVEEIRPLKVGLDIKSLYKFKAGNTAWWTNENGIIIKEENPAGFTLYSQVEKIAKIPSDRVLFDHTTLPFIKSDKLLGNPEELNRLKIKIHGFTFGKELYANSSITLEDNILTIQKEDEEALKNKTYRLPYTGGNLDRHLSSDEWASSDYKPLHDTGTIYAKSNQYDAILFAEYLTGYLYNLVRTRPLFILQSAKDFLASLTGDYLERTVMFASYARAAGLPTRLVGGLIYDQGYFHFHTWPEIWLNKWVPVDPTFFQFPADVSHIPLKEGTLKDIISVVDELNAIRVEVLATDPARIQQPPQ